MTDAKYWVWFASMFGYGTRRADELLAQLDHPGKLYDMPAEQLRATGLLTSQELKKLGTRGLVQAEQSLLEAQRLGCTVLTPDSPHYPAQLRSIFAMPMALYVRGSLEGLEQKLLLAMVGTRKMTAYGKRVAGELSFQLASAGAVIVSGMAMGIDQVCHAGALKAGGRTIAVLGCGIDIDYPKNSRELKELTAKHGAVVTEFPPGTPPAAHNFPIRNRIISGLSGGVVVVEADDRSGSLITAGHALSQGREVFAVPGNIDQPASRGANKLIKQGAKAVTEAMDIAEEFIYSWHNPQALERPILPRPPLAPAVVNAAAAAVGAAPTPPDAAEHVGEAAAPSSAKTRRKPPDYLTGTQVAVYEALTAQPRHVSELAEQTGLELPQLLGSLTELEIYGLARGYPGRTFAIER